MTARDDFNHAKNPIGAWRRIQKKKSNPGEFALNHWAQNYFEVIHNFHPWLQTTSAITMKATHELDVVAVNPEETLKLQLMT